MATLQRGLAMVQLWCQNRVRLPLPISALIPSRIYFAFSVILFRAFDALGLATNMSMSQRPLQYFALTTGDESLSLSIITLQPSLTRKASLFAS